MPVVSDSCPRHGVTEESPTHVPPLVFLWKTCQEAVAFFFSPSDLPTLILVFPFSFPKLPVSFLLFFAVGRIRIVLSILLRVLIRLLDLLYEEVLAVGSYFQHKGHSLLKAIMPW